MHIRAISDVPLWAAESADRAIFYSPFRRMQFDFAAYAYVWAGLSGARTAAKKRAAKLYTAVTLVWHRLARNLCAAEVVPCAITLQLCPPAGVIVAPQRKYHCCKHKLCPWCQLRDMQRSARRLRKVFAASVGRISASTETYCATSLIAANQYRKELKKRVIRLQREAAGGMTFTRLTPAAQGKQRTRQWQLTAGVIAPGQPWTNFPCGGVKKHWLTVEADAPSVVTRQMARLLWRITPAAFTLTEKEAVRYNESTKGKRRHEWFGTWRVFVRKNTK